MKIKNTNISKIHISNKSIEKNSTEINTQKISEHGKISNVPFKAIYGVKNKKIDIEVEKNKILKQINTVLETYTEEIDFEQFFLMQLIETVKFEQRKNEKLLKLIDKIEELHDNRTFTPKQKLDIANALKKEYVLIKNSKLTIAQPPKKTDKEYKTDYALYNKFKSALIENNFNLEKVYTNHYSKLEQIKTIEELKQAYPHIKIPQKPEIIIAEKITNTLTRDFYENLDEYYHNGDNDGIVNLFNNKLAPIIYEIAGFYEIDVIDFSKKITETLTDYVTQKYANLLNNDNFSSIPQARKIKKPIISENDVKLLYVDYDKFVLNIIKEQYLNKEKLNNIIYEENDIKIQAGTLKEPAYKFDKVQDKIKSIINLANELKKAQRNYAFYTQNDFKKRLDFYANNQIANNEKIYERIIDFYTCNFEKEDIEPLILFLKELDALYDEENTENNVEIIIKKNNLYPRGTQQKDEIKNKEIAQKFKIEQQKNFELKTLKEKFDEALNTLYANNLNNIAFICSKYRPESLNINERNNYEFIINTINSFVEENTINITNKTLLSAKILRFDTYNNYKINNKETPLFINSLKFAKDENGNINTDKAGQYIINAGIIENYPKSVEYFKNPNLLHKIMEKSENNEQAIEYLCKLDNYNNLTSLEKTYLSKILNTLNIRDNVEKSLIKIIIDTEYAQTNTSKELPINEANETRTVTIDKKAKQEIIEKYKFPTCIEYLEGFEEAITHLSTEKGNSGVKLTSRNNEKLKYKMEVKLAKENDRLFSSKNDFCFDIFSPIGLH